GGVRRFGALEIRIGKLLENDRMAARPGLTRQTFLEAEPQRLAGSTEFVERPVIAIQELQLLAIRRRMPDLDHADEALLRGLRRRDRGADIRRGPRESFALWSSIRGTPPSPTANPARQWIKQKACQRSSAGNDGAFRCELMPK